VKILQEVLGGLLFLTHTVGPVASLPREHLGMCSLRLTHFHGFSPSVHFEIFNWIVVVWEWSTHLGGGYSKSL